MMQQTKASFLVLLLFASTFANGQQFRHSAKLDSIGTSGFYIIVLNSEILSYLRTDCADLRIEDKDKKSVPYLLRVASTPLQQSSFIEFPILSNRLVDSGKTEIILSNDSAKQIHNIKLFIKNAAVSRTGSLSGSNDRQKWFIVDDQVLIGRSYESVKDEYLQEILFPMSNYRFYKLIIDNQKNDPMNIVRAGTYTVIYWKRLMQFEYNPLPDVKSTDSGAHTLVHIQHNRPYQISHISLSANGPKFFKREFQLYSIDSASASKRFIGEFSLNSDIMPEFDFPLVKTDRLLMVIDNKDNPPLKIERLQTQHISMDATAYLEKGNSYTLLMDNPESKAPDYDLVHFKDSIPQSIAVLNPHSITTNEILAGDSQSRNWWIWPVLIGVIAIMGLLTYKLSGDVKANVKN